ncbi:hypothetical protein GCM10010168_35360 [Actinoplanes ianthinogenes]|uniref:Uncharacterized protein n=1 Tax=Actinoplanes ianthinogenes TaxID=122358 RepID=A0ABM7M5L4_9ACTN|nr:hypothetical protein [Actinoplanes ianthinogenes]BCJ46944.1 hypothetical protein Aiant_76010 [Actinoplanes ianthinogenes]GGR14463.1 hypothetical protein GCM10010168_35360 [Actinoplanes ianthinogenes]
MTGTNNKRQLSGLIVGSLVALSFGTVFVMVNSAELSSPWQLVIRVVAVLVAAGLLVLVFRTERASTPAQQSDVAGFSDPAYRYAVIFEVVALFGGLFVINGVLKKPDVAVAWVAVVVGLHFFPLGRAWRMPFYYWLGGAMTVLGLAGFLAHAAGASAATVALISGVGSGFALYAAVLMGIRDTRSRQVAAAAR